MTINNRIFNRYERKYILDRTTMDLLIPFFRQYLTHDPYSQDGHHYTIYNIYFDTEDYGIIRNSIQKPPYKEKLRLRTYDHPMRPESECFLEIKKKYVGRVNKRRLTLTYQDAIAYLEKGIKPTLDDALQSQIFKEIDYFITLHKAKPGAYIRYDRIALLSESDDLRITFDFNIIFRTTQLTLDKTSGRSILPSKDNVLMEIKSDNNFPLWLAQKLSSLKLYSQSYSKYGKAYEYYLGGQTDDDLFHHD